MRRIPALLVLAGFGLTAGGCKRVDGEKWADNVNQKVVTKINNGEVKNRDDLAKAEKDAQREALKDMGFSDPDKALITEPEKKKFIEKCKTYWEGWDKLLIEKASKKP